MIPKLRMKKGKSRYDSALESLPSFNKADRLSVKVASLQLAQHLSDVDTASQGVVQRHDNRCRRTLGGRGREWAAESLKLLEALLELEDSKPIREPVNPLKFPEYYTQTLNPLDLSKIMLKFHGGSYESLEAFSRDMRSMFSNYKSFFKEQDAEIYTQVHRLSWWFEAEMSQIIEKWGNKYPMSMLRGRKSAAGSSAAESEATQRRIGSEELRQRQKISKEADTKPDQAIPIHVAQSRASPLQTVPLETGPLEIDTSHSPSPTPSAVTDVYNASLHSRTKSEPLAPSLARLKPGTLAQLKVSQRSLATAAEPTPVAEPSSRPAAEKSKRILSEAEFLLVPLQVSNIWFGSARIKPKKPAFLSEAGLQLFINYGDQEAQFTIHAEEIVRCVGHFGKNSQKHTLFLFVLPSCSKRLEVVSEKFANSNMIVVFLNASSLRHISSMIHIFWSIGRKSLFGPIFSEVDQQAALTLLGNIKPGILNRVANKYKGAAFGIPASGYLLRENSDEGPAKKRKRFVLGGASAKPTTTTSTSTSGEVTEPVMPDSSVQSGVDTEEGTSTAGAGAGPPQPQPQQLSKEFAETLGASLQQGFKEGFTEVLKNLADTLYGKTRQQLGGEDGLADTEEESDIEIVIPTDSEDEESKPNNGQMDVSSLVEDEEDELSVTREKFSLRCPITQQVMKHPLKNRHCNHCYDRQGVEELIKNRQDKAKCPVPGCSNDIPLDMNDMRYENILLKSIQDKIKSAQKPATPP